MKGYVFEVDLEYPKELLEFHNEYPLAPDKIRNRKRNVAKLSNTVKIADFYNIPIGNIKTKLVSNSSDKEKYAFHYENLQFYFKARIETKKIHRLL